MFDVAIVGGWLGGLRARESACRPTSKRKVVLIEAGPPKHGALFVRAPMLYQKLWYGKLCWNYKTVPQAHVDQPRDVLAARQGDRRLEQLQRDGLHPRPPRQLRRVARPRQSRLGLRRRAAVLQAVRGQRARRVGVSRRRRAAAGATTVEPSAVARAFVDATAARCGVPITDDFNGAIAGGRRLLAGDDSRRPTREHRDAVPRSDPRRATTSP